MSTFIDLNVTFKLSLTVFYYQKLCYQSPASQPCGYNDYCHGCLLIGEKGKTDNKMIISYLKNSSESIQLSPILKKDNRTIFSFTIV